MIALQKGLETARTLPGGPPLDLAPLLERLDLEMLRWRFQGRLREVIIEGIIGIDERLPSPWVRWLTAHAIGHHLLHTGTWLYLDSWQWVATLKAERQAEEFAAGLLMPPDSIWCPGTSCSGPSFGHPGIQGRLELAVLDPDFRVPCSRHLYRP